jgi:hypothetical protein
MSKALRQRSVNLSPEICAIAWKAQKRLHNRFGRLIARGKPSPKAVTAVARELDGFVWAISQKSPPPEGAACKTSKSP